MARTTTHDQLARVLRFLSSLTHPQVRAVLGLRGFDEAERALGWAFFDAATGRHVAGQPLATAAAAPSTAIIAALDEWENVWFDVMDASLRRSFPDVHQRLIGDLGKAEGLPVVLNVRTVVKRLDALKAEGGERNTAALALLEKRGLGPAEIERARNLLVNIETQTFAEPALPDADADAAHEKALAELWGWYLDWTKLARTVVRSRALQLYMGLAEQARRPRGGEPQAPDDAEDADAVDEEPPAANN